MYVYVCVGVTITTLSLVQSALVNLVPAYSRSMFGDFGCFSNANIFGTRLKPHIPNTYPYGTQLGLQEFADRFLISATV